jgi:hypothetical protein
MGVNGAGTIVPIHGDGLKTIGTEKTTMQQMDRSNSAHSADYFLKSGGKLV